MANNDSHVFGILMGVFGTALAAPFFLRKVHQRRHPPVDHRTPKEQYRAAVG